MGKTYEVVVIGAGPGGYVAAIRAAQLGLRVAVVEREQLGGVCLNWGCIPTKALLASASIYRNISHAAEFGILAKNVSIDFSKVVQHSRTVANKLAGGIQFLLNKNGVEVIKGHGKLLGASKLEVHNEKQERIEISAKHIILATGSRARALPGIKLPDKYLWSYKEAMLPDALPKSLLVVGSGAIGVEFASFYNALGVQVTIVELFDRILRAEDEEIALAAHKSFEKQGMQIFTQTTVKSANETKGRVEVVLESKDGKTLKLAVDRIISAIGIQPNLENLGLEKTKVALDNGLIKTDPYLRTDEPGVYAIGDVTKGPWLAHKASEEAVVCVEKIAGRNPHPIERNNIPGCTYCHPQIASIGLSEEDAAARGKIKVGRFPLSANGKAIAMGETEGFVKVIFDVATGELLGAHMIGAEVTEMIQGFAIAKQLEGTELDLMHTIFPHPTISEAMKEAALDADKQAIHI
ncbi:MAG: dihydrolipoyl dehydrogenase [Proteobacteria bacterium]|nr:dihydrolipoyl dehydrogenase [Pseudomonadota bacterium]